MRLALYLALLLALPHLVLWVFWPDYRGDQRVDQFYEVAPDLHALSLGSSHTRALHFPTMEFEGYSFADDSGDIETAEFKLRLALDYTKDLQYVFLTVSPGYLSYSQTAINDANWQHRASILRYSPVPKSLKDHELSYLVDWVRAHLLSFEALLAANKRIKSASGDLFRKAISSDSEKFQTQCRVVPNPTDHPDEDGIPHGFLRTPLPTLCLKKRAIIEATMRATMINEALVNKPGLLEANKAALLRMADLLEDHGASLVLVIPPMTQEYFESVQLQKHWPKELKVLEFISERDNVVMIDGHDFFNNQAYLDDNQWFSDGNHLTLNGAKIFSDALTSYIPERWPPHQDLLEIPAAEQIKK